MNRNKLLRWVGTISYIIGIALTSFNVYPWNLIFQANGALFWVSAAVGVMDLPLLLLEGYACLSYGSGLVYAIWKLVS